MMLGGSSSTDKVVLLRRTQDWRVWLLAILIIGLLGLGASIYTYVRGNHSTLIPVSDIVPPLLFGFFSLFLLLNFYMAQKEGILEALREQLVAQKIEAELNRELSLLDPVTEVYNRRYARIMLEREAGRVARYGVTMGVMMVDVTAFRRVNESLGHTGGDVALRQIAYLLQRRIRNSDIIVRYGGDEFLLILPDAQRTGIERLTVRLKKALEDWAPTAGLGDFGLRFAIGVAYYEVGSQIERVLTLAEDRMLQDRSPSATAASVDEPQAVATTARRSDAPDTRA